MRVGIIGAGWWAARHTEALAQLPGFSVVSVSSASLSSAQAFARQVGASAYPSHQALLASGEVEAVLVAAPHRLHAELALDVLEAGVPLLLEKPTAITPEDVRRVTAAATTSGVPCLIGLTSHYFPGFRAARALLDSGVLGRAVMGQSTFQKLWMEENRQPWHLDRQQGGGMLLTAGIHALDRVLWLMNARVTAVSAVIGTYQHVQQADDLASLFLRLEGHAAAQVSSVGYAFGGPINRTEVICERGALRVTADTLEIGEEEGWRPVSLELPDDLVMDALGREWLDLAGLMRGEQPAVTSAFAAELMDVLFLAERSAAKGREFPISSLR